MKSLVALQNRMVGDHSSVQRIEILDSFEHTEAKFLIYLFK